MLPKKRKFTPEDYDSFIVRSPSHVAEDDNNSEGRLSVRGGEGTGTLRGSYQEIPSPLVFSVVSLLLAWPQCALVPHRHL